MKEDALRSVLLVKAIEETDRQGTLIPLADRASASREASRAAGQGDRPAAAVSAIAGAALPAKAQRLLAKRAQALRTQLAVRFPIVDTVLALARGPAWIGWLLILASLVLGFVLSALDGSRRINILAFPLLALVIWNLLVYAGVVAGWLRAGANRHRRQPVLAGLVARSTLSRLKHLAGKSSRFNAPLAKALGRFVAAWSEAARPLLVARATRLFHLCAAAVGIGLIVGLYLRGIALRYEAGWESTFLDAEQVRALIGIAYGPASSVSGVPLPDVAHLESIRWAAGRGGENAARWIHLLATTVLLFVVLPRIGLALVSSFAIWGRSRRMVLPPTGAPYFRSVFGALEGVMGRGTATVMPYAYEPTPEAVAQIESLLRAAFGENLAVGLFAAAPYGEEEALASNLADESGAASDVIVLLFNLAATPEDENHGAVIAGARDALTRERAHSALLVLVDEGPYAARMSAHAGPAERLEERRRLWREFAAARGLEPAFADLRADAAGTNDPDRLRAALWHPAAG